MIFPRAVRCLFFNIRRVVLRYAVEVYIR